jgi:copper transport protein
VVWRRLARLVVAAGVMGCAGLAGAPAALAHASLVSTSPADGAVLARAPARVTATFDEQVGVSADSLRVYGPSGGRADAGVTTHTSRADTIEVSLRRGLARGTYTVAWHVVSADSHPVQGAFAFSIGTASPTHVSAAALRPGGSALTGIGYGVARWLAFACFAVLAGAVAFLIACWPDGARHRGVLRLIVAGWAGLAVSTLCALLLQGPYAAGEGIGQLLQPGLLQATMHSRLGAALQARELLVALAAAAVTIIVPGLPAAGTRARAAAAGVWAVLTAALAATWAAADHASVGIQVPLALPADIIHLGAMAIWIGGLITLAAFLLRDPSAGTAAAATAVPRFSAIALGCVTAIVATGAFQTWRQAGTWGALTGTDFGRLVLAKIAGMGIVIWLGYLARRRIHEGLRPAARASALVTMAAPAARPASACPAVPTATSPAEPATTSPAPFGGSGATAAVALARLRRSVIVEIGVAAVILAVTSVLVNTRTGREAYAQPVNAVVQFNTTGGPAGVGKLNAVVTPARLGPNQIHLYISKIDNTPYRPAQVQASLYLPARKLGPLPVALVNAGPGHYLNAQTVIAITGQWQLQVTIRSDPFDETTVSVPAEIH